MAVVLEHLRVFENRKLQLDVLPAFFQLGGVGVDLFFVISGFIMVFIQPEQINSPCAHARFLLSRFTRIYPPYWIVLLPLLPIWLMWPGVFLNPVHDVFRSVLLLPQDSMPILSVGWTLIHEIYFYIIVAFALHFGTKGRWVFGAIWLGAVLAAAAIFGSTNYGGSRLFQLMFSPFSATFLLGYFQGLGLKHIQQFNPRLGLVLFAAGIAAIFFNAGLVNQLGVYPDNNQILRLGAFGLPCGLIVLAALILERHLPEIVLRLQYVGDRSYALYLTHWPVVTLVYTLLAHTVWRGTAVALLISATCFTLCLLTASIFHEQLEKRAIRWSRRALGKLNLA